MEAKILVTGPINGHIDKAFQKISKLCARQSFATILITGDLFANEVDDQAQRLLDGKIPVPCSTYFTVGNHSLPEIVQQKLETDGEICPNLFYLGRKGQHKTAEGIKIVFVGGNEVAQEQSLTQSIGKYDPLFLENEARALKGAHDAHILLTNQWPARIHNGSQHALLETNDRPSTAITNLCVVLKPRYHFSRGRELGWKREPFCWPLDYSGESAEGTVTRFESLGSVTVNGKDWLSAFVLDPNKPPSTEDVQQKSPLTIISQSSRSNVRKRDYDEVRETTHYGRHGQHENKRARSGAKPGNCFMCLGNSQFVANMVVSIADESFCTSLKGPLPEKDTFPQLQSSGSLMIIPLYHAADEAAHGQRKLADRQTEFAEMTRYRHAFQHMLLEKASGQLGAVCWEVNRTGIRHFHWQWVPCAQQMIGKGLVEAAFKVAAEKSQYEAFQSCVPDALLQDRPSDYFRIWIWSAAGSSSTTQLQDNGNAIPAQAGSSVLSPVQAADAIAAGETEQSQPPHGTSETSMYFELPNDQRFNIQFGRSVMSDLLNLRHRADWRSVPAEDGDEARDAEALKVDFKAWDFAMI